MLVIISILFIVVFLMYFLINTAVKLHNKGQIVEKWFLIWLMILFNAVLITLIVMLILGEL